MKRKQFSEEEIIGILKEAEAGAVVTELCRSGLSALGLTNLGDERLKWVESGRWATLIPGVSLSPGQASRTRSAAIMRTEGAIMLCQNEPVPEKAHFT